MAKWEQRRPQFVNVVEFSLKCIELALKEECRQLDDKVKRIETLENLRKEVAKKNV